MKELTKHTYIGFLYIIIAFLAVLILLNSINRYYGHDEFEHVHSSWLIESGQAPYRDFFQNHHPLLWVTLLPLIKIFGHTIGTLIVLRIFILMFTFGIAILVYRLAVYTTQSREVGLYSVIFLLSMVIFVKKGIEIRPDIPQVFFGLLSVYYLIRFLENNAPYPFLALSGLTASVSFLFLQKTVFLIIAFVLIFFLKARKKLFLPKHLVLFTASFLLPILAFGGYLVSSASLKEYILTNWMMHIFHTRSFSPGIILLGSFLMNTVFWILFILACRAILIRKRSLDDLGIITITGTVLLLFTFVVKHPYEQYFVFPVALMSITNAYFINYLFSRRNFQRKTNAVILVAILVIPVVIISVMIFNSNQSQKRKIHYVLENTFDSDYVYDGDIQFNVFRRDLHYFWYSIGNQGLKTYNKIAHGKYADYDACRLIKSKKPKFISDFQLDLERCDLAKVYKPTVFKHLFERIDQDDRAIEKQDHE